MENSTDLLVRNRDSPASKRASCCWAGRVEPPDKLPFRRNREGRIFQARTKGLDGPRVCRHLLWTPARHAS